MSELDLVRSLRAGIPAPSPTRLAVGRARLLASIARPSRSRYRPRAIVLGGVALVAVAGGVVLTAGSRSRVAPSMHLVLAARVLNAAALSAEARPDVRPAPTQWIYTRVVQYDARHGTSTSENWIRFDGRQSAYFQSGQLVVHTGPAPPKLGDRTPLGAYDANTTPMSTYDALRSLPSSPKALLEVVDQVVAANPNSIALPAGSPSPAQSGDQLEFAFLASLLWNSYAGAPSAAEATVFKAIAAIPGVGVERGITNAIGQPAIGLSDGGWGSQLLLDPLTYQVTGIRTVSTGICTAPRTVAQTVAGKASVQCMSWPPKGAVVESLAWARVVPVNGPGQR